MTTMDSRIQQRRREVRRERMHRRRRRTVLAVLIGLLVVAAVAIERSPLVALAEIEVVGTEELDARAVREAADLPLGTSTLRLRLAPAERRIAGLPWVREASLRRVDPLTVRITVVERTPLLVVRGRDGSYLVDEEGVVLEHATRDGLVVVDARGAVRPPAGSSVSEVPDVGNAVDVYLGLPGPLRVDVTGVRANGPDDADLVLTDGTTVRFGRADRIDEKARTLGALLADLEDPPTAVDVRAPANPVVVP